MELSIDVIQSELQTRLPERHRAALLDPHDPVHDCIELLGTDEGNHNNIDTAYLPRRKEDSKIEKEEE